MWNYNNGNEPMLPGLNYDREQLFWISLGLYQCTANDFKTKLKIIDRTNVHEYTKCELVSLLRNSEDFKNDFGCPSDSYMNPIEKCEILE